MSDVDQADDAVHRVGMIDLERVVQREGVDVDDRRLEAGVGEDADLRLDQLALGGDEQHAHLDAVAVGIENLEVELDRFHVERHVLLGFPAHQLARLLLPSRARSEIFLMITSRPPTAVTTSFALTSARGERASGSRRRRCRDP